MYENLYTNRPEIDNPHKIPSEIRAKIKEKERDFLDKTRCSLKGLQFQQIGTKYSFQGLITHNYSQ